MIGDATLMRLVLVYSLYFCCYIALIKIVLLLLELQLVQRQTKDILDLFL